MTYIRIVEDLENMLKTAEQPQDLRILSEIRAAKEDLRKRGYTYFEGHSRPFRLVPEVEPHRIVDEEEQKDKANDN